MHFLLLSLRTFPNGFFFEWEVWCQVMSIWVGCITYQVLIYLGEYRTDRWRLPRNSDLLVAFSYRCLVYRLLCSDLQYNSNHFMPSRNYQNIESNDVIPLTFCYRFINWVHYFSLEWHIKKEVKYTLLKNPDFRKHISHIKNIYSVFREYDSFKKILWKSICIV